MQCVMWLVLAAAVGAAALLNHEIRKRQHVPLDREMVLDQFRIRMPQGWIRSQEETQPGVLAHMAAPQEGQGRRQMLILSRPTEAFLPPREWLDRTDDSTDVSMEQSLDIGGYPGVLIVRRAQLTIGSHAPAEVGVVQACAVFPWRRTAEIYLLSPQAIEAPDIDLVRRVAGHLRLVDRPPLRDARTLHLEGMDIPVPSGWRIAPEDDPNRLAGQLLYAKDGQWLSAEVIPCHVPLATAVSAQTAALRALAGVAASPWSEASVAPGPSVGKSLQWRLDLPIDEGYFRQGRVIRNQQGWGALVLFRGYAVDRSEVNRAWQVMATGLTIDRPNSWQVMVDRGGQAARQWQAMTLNQLIPTREDQWWLWYGSGSEPYVGWLNLQWLSMAADAAVPWRAVWEARMRPGDGSAIRRRQTVGGSADMADYTDTVEEWETGVSGSTFAPAGRLSVRLHQGQLTFVSGPGANQIAQRVSPQGFIGGGWLPLVLGHSPDGPMVVQSESFLFHQSQGTLLDVVIDPTPPPSSRPATQPAIRTLTIHINGDGNLSRWHFSADGELQSIQCPGGLQLLPATPQDLRVDFHGDDRMTP